MTNRQMRWTQVLLVLYLAILVWVILLKCQTSLEALGLMQLRSTNLIPFGAPTEINGQPDYREAVLNLLAFVPFGMYLAALRPAWSWWKKLLPVFLFSLSVEVLQYGFAIGTSDVTDLLMNTLGGGFGLFVFFLWKKLLREWAIPVFHLLAAMGTAGLLLLLAMLFWANG